jgi:hypothetical protein
MDTIFSGYFAERNAGARPGDEINCYSERDAMRRRLSRRLFKKAWVMPQDLARNSAK